MCEYIISAKDPDYSAEWTGWVTGAHFKESDCDRVSRFERMTSAELPRPTRLLNCGED